VPDLRFGRAERIATPFFPTAINVGAMASRDATKSHEIGGGILGRFHRLVAERAVWYSSES
jgi:hypothetical protein